LKNSFPGVWARNFLCKLLNVRSPQALKFAEITDLVPLSTATGYYTTLRRLFAHQPLRSKTLLRPDSSDPIRQRGVRKVKSWLSHLNGSNIQSEMEVLHV
jgi:hypothetical protein